VHTPDLPYPTAGARWGGGAELRADLRSALGLVLVMALVGLPAGVLWWALAPRADFRITETGPEVLGRPSDELLLADDGIFVVILALTGLLLGAAAWLLRRRRGVATVVALAVGATVTGVVAWQVGEVLGAGPTEAQLATVGATVTSSLTLGALPALAVAPFTAILAYVLAVLYSRGDDLGRTGTAPAPPAHAPTEDDGLPWERPLVDVPPPGRPAP
jgi:Protein of unknown function (DUF2567)